MHVYACVYICTCVHVYTVPAEVKRRWWILWSWSYRWFWTILHGCWEPNLGLLQEQQILLTAELSPTPICIFVGQKSPCLSWHKVQSYCGGLMFSRGSSVWTLAFQLVDTLVRFRRCGLICRKYVMELGFMDLQAAFLSVQSPWLHTWQSNMWSLSFLLWSPAAVLPLPFWTLPWNHKPKQTLPTPIYFGHDILSH